MAQWLKARAQEERSIAAQSRVDELAREAFRLRLRADENRDAENHSAEAEEKSAFPMQKKTQRNIEGRRHGLAAGPGAPTSRFRINCPGRNLS